MQIILRDDVAHLGRRGEIVKVREGYARNFLIPHGLAYRVTPGIKRQVEVESRAKTARDQRERQTAQDLATRLGALTVLRFSRRAGENGTLFGSVTAADIAEELTRHKFEIDKRSIRLDEPIKRTGTYRVAVHVFRDLDVTLPVEVEAGEQE